MATIISQGCFFKDCRTKKEVKKNKIKNPDFNKSRGGSQGQTRGSGRHQHAAPGLVPSEVFDPGSGPAGDAAHKVVHILQACEGGRGGRRKKGRRRKKNKTTVTQANP